MAFEVLGAVAFSVPIRMVLLVVGLTRLAGAGVAALGVAVAAVPPLLSAISG